MSFRLFLSVVALAVATGISGYNAMLQASFIWFAFYVAGTLALACCFTTADDVRS